MRRRLPLLLLFLASCATTPSPVAGAGQASGASDHPLVGRIYDVRSGAFVAREALEQAVARADLVLLGEVHDNPEHHRLQASLVRAAARGGGRPAVAFEMIDVNLQPALESAGGEPEAVAAAVDWDRSGWPSFALYRPIFEVAQAEELRLIAANLPRAAARAVVMEGADSLEPALQAEVERHWPRGAGQLAAAHEEMRVAHCGHLPEAMLEPMVLAQLARDAQLARSLLNGAGEGRAILIAGNGHVRRSGVPRLLDGLAPGRRRVSVGMFEVDPEVTSASEAVRAADAASEGRAPAFDFVLFTPAQDREDPCEGLKKKAGG